MALIKQDIETLLNLKLVEADAIRERKFHVCVDAVYLQSAEGYSVNP